MALWSLSVRFQVSGKRFQKTYTLFSAVILTVASKMKSVSAPVMGVMGAQARLRSKAVNYVSLNPFGILQLLKTWKLYWATSCFVSAMFCLSPHLLQLLRRMLRCHFSVRLQINVSWSTTATLNFPSAWKRQCLFVHFLEWVNYPRKCCNNFAPCWVVCQ